MMLFNFISDNCGPENYVFVQYFSTLKNRNRPFNLSSETPFYLNILDQILRLLMVTINTFSSCIILYLLLCYFIFMQYYSNSRYCSVFFIKFLYIKPTYQCTQTGPHWLPKDAGKRRGQKAIESFSLEGLTNVQSRRRRR